MFTSLQPGCHSMLEADQREQEHQQNRKLNRESRPRVGDRPSDRARKLLGKLRHRAGPGPAIATDDRVEPPHVTRVPDHTINLEKTSMLPVVEEYILDQLVDTKI